MYILKITEKAKRDLNRLEKYISQRIIEKLEFYIVQENPLCFAKRMVDSDL